MIGWLLWARALKFELIDIVGGVCSGRIDCEFVNQKLEERFSLLAVDDNEIIEDFVVGREKWLWPKIICIYIDFGNI